MLVELVKTILPVLLIGGSALFTLFYFILKDNSRDAEMKVAAKSYLWLFMVLISGVLAAAILAVLLKERKFIIIIPCLWIIIQTYILAISFKTGTGLDQRWHLTVSSNRESLAYWTQIVSGVFIIFMNILFTLDILLNW